MEYTEYGPGSNYGAYSAYSDYAYAGKGRRHRKIERLSIGDLTLGCQVAGVVAFLLVLWGFPGLLPSQWQDASVAFGIRPAVSVMPGYYRLVSSFLVTLFGARIGSGLIGFLGYATLALTTGVVYIILRELLAFVMRLRPQYSRRRTFVMRIASVTGAFLFVCCDPVWMLGQGFSEVTIELALFIGSLQAFFLFLRKGSIKYAYICALLVGLLAAETAIGMGLMLSFVALNFVVMKVVPSLESPFFKPEVIAIGKWKMTFIFVAAFLFGIFVNCASFAFTNGLGAVGKSAGSVPLDYLLAYWSEMSGVTNQIGWLLFGGVFVMPLVVSIIRFTNAIDEDRFLPYSTGMIFFVTTGIAITQSCALPATWFWKYCTFNSPLFLAIGSLFGASTVAFGMTVFGVDAVCRNHAGLAKQEYSTHHLVTDEEAVADLPTIRGILEWPLSYWIVFAVALGIIALMLPGRIQKGTRLMLGVIRDAVEATVEEAGDVEYLFTDGNLDPAVEIESRRQGGEIKCLSLMGKANAYDAYLRTRGMQQDAEDMYAFSFDCGMGLRTWIHDKPARLGLCAVQLGFDLWRRDGRALPKIGGFVSHPLAWPSEEMRYVGIERANELAERILEIYSRGLYRACNDSTVQKAFCAVQWRIARMAFYRGEVADLVGDGETAVREANLAKRLNDCNEVFKGLLSTLRRHNEQMQRRMTPREGLHLALVRADFAASKVYADVVLAADADNPDANFAMGMYCESEKQLPRAEEYLKRCLIKRPNEPSVYNNLAMIQLKLGKLDAAEVNVEKALRIIPDSDAVLDTRKLIREAKANAAAEAASGGNAAK